MTGRQVRAEGSAAVAVTVTVAGIFRESVRPGPGHGPTLSRLGVQRARARLDSEPGPAGGSNRRAAGEAPSRSGLGPQATLTVTLTEINRAAVDGQQLFGAGSSLRNGTAAVPGALRVAPPVGAAHLRP